MIAKSNNETIAMFFLVDLDLWYYGGRKCPKKQKRKKKQLSIEYSYYRLCRATTFIKNVCYLNSIKPHGQPFDDGVTPILRLL